MDIDSYIKGFKEIYDMAKLKFPILETEEVIHPRKEEAFTRALSRYLCADMINEIIKIARPLTFKIFREERHFQKAFKDSVESGTRSRCSFVSPLSEDGFIGRDGDVLLGIYSKVCQKYTWTGMMRRYVSSKQKP